MINITDLNDIDSSSKEGQYLMAAMAFITTTNRTDKTPYEVLDELGALRALMFLEEDSRHLNPPMPEMPINNWTDERSGMVENCRILSTQIPVHIHSGLKNIQVYEQDGKIHVAPWNPTEEEMAKLYTNGDDRLL